MTAYMWVTACLTSGWAGYVLHAQVHKRRMDRLVRATLETVAGCE